MKASKELSSRLCPLGDVPPSSARRACRVWFPGPLTPRWFPPDLAAAPALACSCLRGLPGAPGGRRLRDPRSRAGGVRPHTQCSELAPRVPRQAGRLPMPRLLHVPCRSSGRHSALVSGPFLRQVPRLVLVSEFVAGVSAVLPPPPRARGTAVGSAV